MMPPRQVAVTGAAVAFIAMMGYLAVGVLTPDPGPDGLTSTVGWGDAGAPDADAGITCVLTYSVQAQVAALAPLGLRTDAGPQCGVVSMCAEPSSGIEPTLPPEVIALTATQEEEEWDGGPQFAAWLSGAPDLPRACACSTGNEACEVERYVFDEEWNIVGTAWEPAPPGELLNHGQWRGPCHTMVCTEPEPGACWPPECPTG